MQHRTLDDLQRIATTLPIGRPTPGERWNAIRGFFGGLFSTPGPELLS